MPRQPKQSRSKATVDAIVEAGFMTVAAHGAQVSTRQIAEVAGVSVGSLYEYFSNKDAIYTAMQERFIGDVMVLIGQEAPNILVLPIDEGVRRLLNAFKRLLLANDQRYLLAAQALIQQRQGDYAQPIRDMLTQLVEQLVISRPEYGHLKDVPTMAYILINASIYLFIDHLSAEQPPISFDELVDGLVGVVSRYVNQR